MYQITINWWIKDDGRRRISGTDTFTHPTKLDVHTATDTLDGLFEKSNFASIVPKFFTASKMLPLKQYGVSVVKCQKITPPQINKPTLSKLLGEVTVTHTDGYKYRRTVYRAEKGDLKITVYVYTYHGTKTKDYALVVEQNSHIKDGTPEAKALLHKHGNLSTYCSGGDCYFNALNQDFTSPAALLETLQKFLETNQ